MKSMKYFCFNQYNRKTLVPASKFSYITFSKVNGKDTITFDDSTSDRYAVRTDEEEFEKLIQFLGQPGNGVCTLNDVFIR